MTHDQAFNAGCDARLAGRHYTTNPLADPQARVFWRRGWFHVEEKWGKDARPGREVKPLPMVPLCSTRGC